MRRREFISLIASAATLPLGARAERAGKPPVIGLIAAGSVVSTRPFAELTVQRLGELGWVVGRDVVVDYRYEEGSLDRASEAVAEFVRMKVISFLYRVIQGPGSQASNRHNTDPRPSCGRSHWQRFGTELGASRW
jgi:putative ABC transport system substrate-binding protein